MRINLVNPNQLTDQHLIAEYNEILMALKMLEKYQDRKHKIPKRYCLGTGHIIFFKDKISYLIGRHKLLAKEMKIRNFKPRLRASKSCFKKCFLNNWLPDNDDLDVIKERISSKLSLKPDWYRYYGEHRGLDYYINLLNYGTR